MTGAFITGMDAGERAWREGVTLSTVFWVAGAQAREYATGCGGLTERESVVVRAIYGDAFISAYCASGAAHAEQTDDTGLAARLRLLEDCRPF